MFRFPIAVSHIANTYGILVAIESAKRFATEPVDDASAREYIYIAHKYTADYNSSLRVKHDRS